ncbi:MAG: hypothetical protein LBS76_03800 [Mycoplasmataceae bacterium]|nr:hypothetical protein [Mycoplasmataceae bacterium]
MNQKQTKPNTPKTWEEWGKWFDRKSIENSGCDEKTRREVVAELTRQCGAEEVAKSLASVKIISRK